jgi:hypothetical protein
MFGQNPGTEMDVYDHKDSVVLGGDHITAALS